MNNQIPFFNPFNPIPMYDYERLYEKIERIEKDIRTLKSQVSQLEKNNNVKTNDYNNDKPTDMYMI